ncbi:cytochrome c3 family protein [candidate division KSB1 bacterium]|nr:cytochrome c3 family protein [candidate division KSB1 bacterium]
MRKFILVIAIMALVFAPFSIRAEDVKGQCQNCHICTKPTADDPCLQPCPRHDKSNSAELKKHASDAPDVVVLNAIEHLFEPVTFAHKLHANMSEMEGSCDECHHYTPANSPHPACKDCHSLKMIRDNLEIPSLKAAYHIQCIGCHKEWNNERACERCHLSKTEPHDKQQYQKPHFLIYQKPEKKSYHISAPAGEYVTFFHENHAQYYGVQCKDCHHDESCGRCHNEDANSAKVIKANQHVMNDKCAQCHDVKAQAGCNKCHSKTEQAQFDHKQASGWELKSYHSKLECSQCHIDTKKFNAVNKKCSGCHNSWNEASFEHGIVGLELDETHVEAACSDCHNGAFEAKSTCVNCHDERPASLPGKRVK